MGKYWSSKLIVNVPVIIRLSETPLIGTVLDDFCASVVFPDGTYFNGVWAWLRAIYFGMLWVSIKFKMLLRYKSSASLLTPSGISNFPIVANLLANPLQRKRLCAHGLPRETWFILSSLLCFKNPFAVAVEILVLITVTRFLATIRYFWILASFLQQYASSLLFDVWCFLGTAFRNCCVFNFNMINDLSVQRVLSLSYLI